MFNDALIDPLRVIKTVVQTRNLNCTASEFPTQIATHFLNIFKDNERLKQVTPLDVSHSFGLHSNHAPQTLVRFRAMVQDTSISREFYPSILSDGTPGAWGLAESTDLNSLTPDLQSLRQREVVWAVTVPGESPFVSEFLDDADSPKVIPSEVPRNTTLNYRHKDPLLRTSHVGLQVKIYDTSITPLKPTDIYTFVGFLTQHHITLDDSLSADTEHDSNPFALHVLFAISHTLGYSLNFFPSVESIGDSLHLPSQSFDVFRDELVEWIATEGLGGDRDAAVWVLLACISKVYSRQPAILPLSLTISKCPSPEKPLKGFPLVKVLRLLLPLLVDVPLSLPFINTRPFFPESRDDDLHSGLLQLPAGTVVLLSEFEVQEGAINDCGVRNIQVLQNIVKSQSLDYKFPYASPYQFPTDLVLIVLTHGDSSLFLSTQVNVPAQYNHAAQGVGSGCIPPRKIAAFRALIRNARMGDVQITEDISHYIQSDFVLERQNNQKTTPDDLMTWISLSKLLALSYNQTNVTIEVWNEAKELEKRRKARLDAK